MFCLLKQHYWTGSAGWMRVGANESRCVLLDTLRLCMGQVQSALALAATPLEVALTLRCLGACKHACGCAHVLFMQISSCRKVHQGAV
jgi:hypothetical protein